MLIKDQMTRNPVHGHPDMAVIEAQELMKEKGFRHLPILDDEKRLVGLITMRSLLRAVPSDVSKFSPFVVNYVLAKIKARNIMVKDVVTITEDTPFEEAARIMADEKIGCLPVMRGDELVGIISDNDLFNTMGGNDLFWILKMQPVSFRGVMDDNAVDHISRILHMSFRRIILYQGNLTI